MTEKNKNNSDLPDNTNPGFSSQKAGQKKAQKEHQELDSHGRNVDKDNNEKL